MAADSLAHGVQNEDQLWQGAQEPFKASYGKLMMWYFLLSDAFTFAGFLIAYGALRFSTPTWPQPDFVFSALPGDIHHKPLIFVTIMTFILIASSVTMVRAVQEGHLGNKKGVVFWMIMTIVGGAMFLGCQAWEWTTLIGGENMSVSRNPFGSHAADGVYVDAEGKETGVAFKAGDAYLIGSKHHLEHAIGTADAYGYTAEQLEKLPEDKNGLVQLPIKYTQGPDAGTSTVQQYGPKAFGALFFFITGFHGFHVFSGVVFLTLICVNVASGLYARRQNHYEMVEKIGLYWHFVDLVWVFVFLVFYLI
jgi:cytochrome c oxidase subunit III